jgi:hypothetical protein
MTRRSTSSTRTLVPPEGTDWQDPDRERDAAAEETDDAEETVAIDGDAAVDLDETDDLALGDTAVLAVTGAVAGVAADENVDALLAELESPARRVTRQSTRRNPGAARRQLEDYWEQRRMARALEDLEDFEV